MEELIIKKADTNDFEKVMEFYYNLIDSMQNAEFKVLWKKDVYPTEQFIHNSIINNELIIAIIDHAIMGSMIMNHNAADDYSKIQWKIAAERNEVMIIHALAISSEQQGKGMAKKMVKYCMEYCRENKIKAIRLDVLNQNKPAHHLYTKMGFAYIDKIQLYYEDTGLTDFVLYELVL